MVNGDVDVRGAAARLPEEIGEPEPLEEAKAQTDAQDGADDLGEVAKEIEV